MIDSGGDDNNGSEDANIGVELLNSITANHFMEKPVKGHLP
jgi:hypothetical protein